MENKTKLTSERWVEEQMALLAAPDDWEADPRLAHTRLQGRTSEHRPSLARMWLPRAAMVGLICLVLLFAIPTTRALTEQVWQWLTLPPFEVVQADFDKLKGKWLILRHSEKEVEAEGDVEEDVMPTVSAMDLTEAASRAGFVPRLPRDGVPSATPSITTIGPLDFCATLKAADLELSLREAGVIDQPIPKEWDGAQLSIKVGPSVFIDWHGEMALVQHAPITLAAPAGFDFGSYWTAALRAAGVGREQALKLAARMKTSPSLLLGIGKEEKVAIREVNLRNGTASLIESIDETGRVRHVTLSWRTPDRVFLLAGVKSGQQAIKVANSVK
jgi:hypothetical protein